MINPVVSMGKGNNKPVTASEKHDYANTTVVFLPVEGIGFRHSDSDLTIDHTVCVWVLDDSETHQQTFDGSIAEEEERG